MPERSDWTLLAISLAKEPATPVQLQKSLFLLGKDLPSVAKKNYYNFSAYHYGPFASAIYADADALEAEGLVTVSPYSGHPRRVYSVTEEGRAAAKAVAVKQSEKSHLANLMEWAQSQSFADLVSSVYERYPEMRRKSIFRG